MRKTSRLLSASLAAAAATALIAPSALAQSMGNRFIITPYVGVYTPTTDVLKMSGAGGGVGASIAAKQKTAMALGANASYWLSERTALELGGVYAHSDLEASASIFGNGDPFAGSASEHAYILAGSAKVMFNLLPPAASTNLRFGVGPAIIHRGGDAYRADAAGELTGLTDVGGVASLCTRLGLTRSLGLRLRAESYLYQTKLGFKDPTDPSGSVSFDSKFQSDFVFSAGLQFGFGR